MSPDRLIIGNAYLWLDQDGQTREVLYQRAMREADGTLVYRFRVRIPDSPGYSKNLTPCQVRQHISQYYCHVH